MASYEVEVSGHTVTINYQLGGTNQVGVKKPSKVKSWALCPCSGKQILESSNSVGEATRAVERAIAESIEKASATPEPAEVA